MNTENFASNMELGEDILHELGIEIEKLVEIYEDFESKKDEFKIHADFIANILRESSKAHSVRSRVKDSKSLINKIVRKTKEKQDEEEEFSITIDNYLEFLEDLIGVRILHVFKDDWDELDTFITERWKPIEAKANIREGDNRKIFEQKSIEITQRETGYRSVHYIIELQPTNKKIKAEIQVRTIFEEGYGEIDHSIRYPNKPVDAYIESHLLLLNRLAGSTDEMGSYTKDLHENLEMKRAEYTEQQQVIDELKTEVEDLRNKLKEEQDITSQAVTNKIDNLSSTIGRLKILDSDFEFPKLNPKVLPIESNGLLSSKISSVDSYGGFSLSPKTPPIDSIATPIGLTSPTIGSMGNGLDKVSKYGLSEDTILKPYIQQSPPSDDDKNEENQDDMDSEEKDNE